MDKQDLEYGYWHYLNGFCFFWRGSLDLRPCVPVLMIDEPGSLSHDLDYLIRHSLGSVC